MQGREGSFFPCGHVFNRDNFRVELHFNGVSLQEKPLCHLVDSHFFEWRFF